MRQSRAAATPSDDKNMTLLGHDRSENGRNSRQKRFGQRAEFTAVCDTCKEVEAKEADALAYGKFVRQPGMYVHRPTEIDSSTGILSNLGLEAFRIPGEQTRSSNVVQF